MPKFRVTIERAVVEHTTFDLTDAPDERCARLTAFSFLFCDEREDGVGWTRGELLKSLPPHVQVEEIDDAEAEG
jgi:hypothetical protein